MSRATQARSGSVPHVNEQFATVGEVRLCYETFGDPADPALLLVMGLGTQMIAWHEDFCRALVDRGFFVVRFDNRDSGRSTRIDAVPPPGPLELATRRIKRVPYTLDDMADDAAGLLGALGIERAHVVGASMGGMIVQSLAARHPDRVRSVVSIMSTTGNRFKGQPAVRLYPFLLAKPPRTREESVERLVKLFAAIGSPGFERDEAELREQGAAAWDRGPSAAGTGRQLAAILASGDRTRALRRVSVPTLVVHGTADRLVRPSGGRATAAAIPGARLLMIDGMGHDLPRGAWPQIIDAIADQAIAADRDAAAAAAG
jgi:pimeloyl-ACP methyl ester carboxylesterase